MFIGHFALAFCGKRTAPRSWLGELFAAGLALYVGATRAIGSAATRSGGSWWFS
jgi:hypothetical protein